jgi:hypothetical protein
LRVRDFSRVVLNSFYDKSHYMEEDIKNVYRHDHALQEHRDSFIGQNR